MRDYITNGASILAQHGVIKDDELAHHGIIGQRKGRRRWQNKDGSLTPEGYIHYGYGLPDKDKERDYWKGLPDKSGKSSSSSSGSSSKNKYDGYKEYFTGDVEGKGTSRYEKDNDYEDADYEDVDYVDAKYKEVDDSKKRYDNTPKQGMQDAINKKSAARSGLYTAGTVASSVANSLTQDIQLTDANGKNTGKIEAPLKTLARKDREKKQARARELNAAGIENLTTDQLKAIVDRKQWEQRYLDATTPQVQSGYDKTMQMLQLVGAIGASTVAVINVANMLKEMKG